MTEPKVDYVIQLGGGGDEATLRRIISLLESNGLKLSFIRNNQSFFILVTCPLPRLLAERKRSNLKGWLRGVPVILGDGDQQDLTPAERLFHVHQLLTNPVQEEQGCGLAPGKEGVEAIFPLHDREFNQKILKEWSKKTLINEQDLDLLRQHFGEQITFYFEFLQFYFVGLAIPAVWGLVSWLTKAKLSVIQGLVYMVWSVAFVEYWSIKQKRLANQWAVRHCSRVEHRRSSFVSEGQSRDALTNEAKPDFPWWKRAKRYAVTFPIIALLGLALTLFIGFLYALEVFFIEYYNGPFSSYLQHLPLIAYVASVPLITGWYNRFAKKLTEYENHELQSQFSTHLVWKMFIMNFLIGYLSIFLTAWVYLPFGDFFEAWLKSYSEVKDVKLGLERLQAQVIYFVVTAQFINVFTEVLVPWAGQRVSSSSKSILTNLTTSLHQLGGKGKEKEDPSVGNELKAQVLTEAQRPNYDLYEDYAEMVIQFGYVSLFSIVWPLTPLLCFLNNWWELRSDAIKIFMTTKRPIPTRVESIGSWENHLKIISWQSSIINMLFIYQFGTSFSSFSTDDGSLFTGLAVVFLAERLYLLLVWLFQMLFHALMGNVNRESERILYNERKQLLSIAATTTINTWEPVMEKDSKLSLALDLLN